MEEIKDYPPYLDYPKPYKPITNADRIHSMTDQELLDTLQRLMVETGSLACLGCGYEHNCILQGCNILREAVAAIQKGMWRSPDREMPEEEILVLVIVNGVFGNITFVDAVSLASYSREEGWILDEYPEWENPGISFWAPIREAPVHEKK